MFVFRSFVQKFILIGFLVEVFLRFLFVFKVFRPEVFFDWVFGRGFFELFCLFLGLSSRSLF